jgi:hypothetical protein
MSNPILPSGMSMMLKSMGIDPAKAVANVDAIRAAAEQLVMHHQQMEARDAAMLDMLTSVLKTTTDLATHVASLELRINALNAGVINERPHEPDFFAGADFGKQPDADADPAAAVSGTGSVAVAQGGQVAE